jgi:ABC-type transport system involved in cytochrome bd biosynthesis fused ATPase/permease subunit
MSIGAKLMATLIVSGFIFLYLYSGGEIEATNILVLMELFEKSAKSSISILNLFETLGALSLSIERVVRFLNVKESKSVTFTKNLTEAKDLKSEYGVEVENCQYFWKKKKIQEKSAKKKSGNEENSIQDSQSENSEFSEDSLNSSGIGASLKLPQKRTKKREYFELTVKDFKAKKGTLTTIIGKMGSGKTSLLKAILGEMPCDLESDESKNSKAIIRGKIAYCSQIPLMINDTVKQNILLGRKFDHKKFWKCIRLACMEHDITTWEDGLEHKVGFYGNSVSGGQKIRIALARCLYTDSDVYFLDDVTSALDNKVGSYILEHTILGHLRDKTVIMVTNNMSCLPRSHQIVLMRHGKIAQKGSFEEMQNLELWNRYVEIMGSWKAPSPQKTKAKNITKDGESEVVPEENPVNPGMAGKSKLDSQIDVLFNTKNYNLKEIFKFLLYSVSSFRNIIIMAVLLCLQASFNATRNQKLT